MEKASPPNYNRIKSVLAEKKRTNLELAKHLEVYPQTVSKWCTNEKQPSIERLFEIAKFLGTEASELISPMKNL